MQKSWIEILDFSPHSVWYSWSSVQNWELLVAETRNICLHNSTHFSAANYAHVAWSISSRSLVNHVKFQHLLHCTEHHPEPTTKALKVEKLSFLAWIRSSSSASSLLHVQLLSMRPSARTNKHFCNFFVVVNNLLHPHFHPLDSAHNEIHIHLPSQIINLPIEFQEKEIFERVEISNFVCCCTLMI